MDVDSYFSKVVEGYEFLIAFLSLIGFIGLLVGFATLLVLEDQETLSYLGVRRAIVIDSIMREKYLIYTLDFNGEILKS